MKKTIHTLTIFLGIILMYSSCENKAKVEKPNFLIILADDAGYADFGFMGSDDIKTPNLDMLANGGVFFTDAHTTGSVCSPSRAGLLTGRYQQRFGHENNSPPHGFGMDPEEVTIADVLKNAGYATGIFGKWHVGDSDEFHPNNRGFDEFYGFLGGHRPYFPNKKSDKPGAHTAVQHNGEYVTFDGYFTDVLGDKTIEFIDANKGKPWFAFLSYNAVHTPMHATKEDMALFEGHPRQKLAAMTWAMDRSIGNVIKKLENDGILDNTLIFFFSDNGGPTNSNTSSNLPLKSQKGYEFEGGHRVPFVVYYKNKIEGGMSFKGLTSVLDVFPTIMHEAGIKESGGKQLDGVDLMPFIQGEVSGEPHDELYWRIGRWAAARVGDYKMVQAKGVDTALYNLDVEIGEITNLKQTEDSAYKFVLEKLSSWEDEVIEPKWPGSKDWINYKVFMYDDLINNREPRFKTLGQVKKHLKENPSAIE